MLAIFLQVEVLLSQFEWKSRHSPTETRLTDRYRSFVIRDSRQFPARRCTGDVDKVKGRRGKSTRVCARENE